MNSVLDLLRGWLGRQLGEPGKAWLDQQLDLAGTDDRRLYLAIGLAPRKLGKGDLNLHADDLAAAAAARPGWDPSGWSIDQAARVALLLVASGDVDSFAAKFEQLCTTADVREQIAFYRGLPLYPSPERYVARAAEGVRTNMKAVFEAIAHRNPYPAEQFTEHVWNHMVLKAVFIGSALHPIQGFDRRRNSALARTLIDYAHERWAAGRDITPELWRAVGPFVDTSMHDDFRRVLGEGKPVERKAAVLALRESTDAGAGLLLDREIDLVAAVDSGRVSWETVYQQITKPQ